MSNGDVLSALFTLAVRGDRVHHHSPPCTTDHSSHQYMITLTKMEWTGESKEHASCANALLVNVMTCTQQYSGNNDSNNNNNNNGHLFLDFLTAMDRLVGAAKESRNGNMKMSLMELTEALKECECNELFFESKLLQLDFQDLEMLYVAFFACEKKRKGSRTLSSFSFRTNKCSVGDASYINDGYEVELKYLEQNTRGSRGGKKKGATTCEDSDTCLLVLRKAYRLKSELSKAQLDDDLLKCLKTILEKHIKVGNLYACALMMSEYEERYVEDLITGCLGDEDKFMVHKVCLEIVNNIWNKGPIPDISECLKCTRLCTLATRLVPNGVRAYAMLCTIYKLIHETKRAYQCATNFLQNVDGTNEEMMVMLVMCQVDEGKAQSVLTRLKNMEANGIRMTRNMVAVRGVLLLLEGNVDQGVSISI